MNVRTIRCYPLREIRAPKTKEEAREIYELNDMPKRHLYSSHKASRMILIKNEITTTIGKLNRRFRRQRIEQNPSETEWKLDSHSDSQVRAHHFERFRIKFSWMINSIVFYRRLFFLVPFVCCLLSWPVSYYIYIHEKRADSGVLIIIYIKRTRAIILILYQSNHHYTANTKWSSLSGDFIIGAAASTVFRVPIDVGELITGSAEKREKTVDVGSTTHFYCYRYCRWRAHLAWLTMSMCGFSFALHTRLNCDSG